MFETASTAQANATWVTHTATDGSLVEFSGSGIDLSLPATSFMEMLCPIGVRHIKTGPNGFIVGVAADLGITSFSEEYTYQSGRLRIGETVQYFAEEDRHALLRLALWEGSKFGMLTSIYGGDSLALFRVVNAVNLEEEP